MSDPRIIECAKAAAEVMGDQYGCDSDRCACSGAAEVLECKMRVTVEEISTAVVLKWLEQAPAGAMDVAGATVVMNRRLKPESAIDIAPDVYAAMCEQAKKEIQG